MPITAKLSSDKKSITFTMPFDSKGTISKSEKSLVHATTSGNTQVMVEGLDKPLAVGINAYTAR